MKQDAWQKFCESLGTRCTFVKEDGERCDNGVVGNTKRCAEHQEKRP